MRLVQGRSLGENLDLALDTLLSRFETLSSFAVVVANYERLRPLEGQYGIANNIWTYTWTAFIPRFIWPNKPKISDARSFSALYFQFGESSFAMTVFGDLLRNFGPIGVSIGMALLGFMLRVLYVAFVENQSSSAWRAASYYLILSGVINYESFYGTILPGMMRLGFVLFLGGIVVKAMVMGRRAGMQRPSVP